MGIITGLRILLAGLVLPFGAYFLTDAWKSRSGFSPTPWPRLCVTGFVTNTLDALGIGSFAQQAAVFKTFKMVDDRVLPGTMNVGNTIPTATQAFIFMTVVAVKPLTLVSMSLAAPVGAVLGAGVVARMSRRRVQLGLGFGLLAVAVIMLADRLRWLPVGGEAIGLTGWKLAVAVAVSFVFGALQTIGVGFYAPCMATIFALGMHPQTAFPIMMTATAMLMAAGSARFVKEKAYDPKAALALTLFGTLGVPVAAYVVKSLPLDALKWVVQVVVIYTAAMMFLSARSSTGGVRMKKASLALILAVAVALPVSGQTVDWTKKALQSERSRSYDAIHYLIKIRLDLDGRAFDGATTVTLASLREGLAACVLDAEEFTVTAVLGNDGTPLAFDQTAKQLEVRLPRPYRFGEELSFTCFYHGREPKAGLRFVAETEDNPGLVFSDSWPDNVHHWFPCYDYPNDKVTDEIVATVRQGLKVAANGRLVSAIEDHGAGTVTYHWSQDLPHSTYLIFLAAAPYVVVRDSFKTLPVSYWVYPTDAAKAGPTFGKTPKMIEFFNRVFGYEYPWQKYDQVSVPSGGGAESTSATAMTHRIMVDEKGEPDFPAIGIVSHELAHQWWGDLVTLRSWAHAWINESFGTYSDYLYHRFEMGDEEGAIDLQGKLDAYLREARTRYVRPIVSDRYDSPEDMFDAHTYPKGARVLHMLRSLVGDEPFFKTLSHFLHRYAFDAADTADFIRSVKTVTGQNLDWFFDQWLYKPGHPVFEVTSEWSAVSKTVRLKVAQVQDFSRGVPVFRVPVSIKLVTPGRTDIRKIWIEKKEETFELPLEERPLLVRFDEDNVLIKEIRFPKEFDELLFQLRHDDVIGRMDAAAALAAFKDDPRTPDALTAGLRSDPFWAVRRSALEALARVGAKSGAAVFKRACQDPDPRVRAAALAALGDFKDRSLVGFFEAQFRKDSSCRVQAEALTAIGKAGDAASAAFLRQAAAVPSFRHMVRKAAEAALGLVEKK